MKNPPNAEELLRKAVEKYKEDYEKRMLKAEKFEENWKNFKHKLGIHDWTEIETEKIGYNKYLSFLKCSRKGCQAYKIKRTKHYY